MTTLHIWRLPNGKIDWSIMIGAALDMRKRGMPIPEIAEAFGVSIASTKSAIERHGNGYQPRKAYAKHGYEAAGEAVAPRKCSSCGQMFERKSRYLFRCKSCKESTSWQAA